jgi:hypothetical protein
VRPRRQLDGGIAPAADCRGGGQARPGSPCCCAVLVGCSPRRRLPGGTSSRHPAVGRCRRGRQGQDACHGVGRRAASTMWYPLSGSVVRVRRSSRPVSGRLVSSPSGVHPSGVQCVQCPAVWCPPVRRPAGCCPPPSVRTRPSRPTSGGGVGDQAGAVGNLHHRNGSSPGGLPRLGAARWTAEQARTRAMLPRSRWSVGVGGGPGPGGVTAGGRA